MTEAVTGARRNILFICSRNQWRSPTAEKIWRRHPGLAVRSAGTSAAARRTVTAKDIDWADVIFVMEDKHKSRLLAAFPRPMQYKTVHILDIPDEYGYMDTDLVDMLRESVSAQLGLD